MPRVCPWLDVREHVIAEAVLSPSLSDGWSALKLGKGTGYPGRQGGAILGAFLG